MKFAVSLLFGSSLLGAGGIANAAPAATAGSWRALSGIAGAEIESLAFSPAQPDIGLAGSNGGNVFLSSNGGAKWARIQVGGPSEFIAGVRFAPAAPATAYAVSYLPGGAGSVYVSTNSGGSWAKTASQPPGFNNQGLIASGLVVQQSGGTLIVGDNAVGVYRSTDGGNTWTNTLAGVQVFGLAEAGVSSSTLWAVGLQQGGPEGFSPSVWRSVDDGVTWTAQTLAGVPAGSEITNVAVNPVTGRVFIAWYRFSPTAKGGVLYSDTQGASWVAADSGLPATFISTLSPDWLAFDPASPGHVVMAALSAGGAGGLYESTNSGKSWTATGARMPGELPASVVVLRPSTASTAAALFAGQDDLFAGPVSTAALTPSDTGMKTASIMDMAEDGASAAGLFAVTYNGVYHSANFGTSWSAISTWPGDHYVFQAMRQRAGGSQALYVLDGDGRVFLTANAGSTWQDVTPTLAAGEAVTQLFADPGSAPQIYATTSSKTFLASSNGGTSWTSSKLAADITTYTELSGYPPVAVAFKPAGTLYALSAAGSVEVSRDYGATWAILKNQPATDGYAQYSGSIAVQQVKPFGVFLSDGGGTVAVSTTGGTSWTTATAFTSQSSTGLSSVPGEPWIVGTSVSFGQTGGLLAQGCLVSKDTGATAANACNTLPELYGEPLLWTGAHDLFIAGTAGAPYALPYGSLPAAQ